MSRGHDDYQSEPVRGLPERLPPGEQILWQGAPRWWQLTKDVFHFRGVALYFAALMLWRGTYRFADTAGDVPSAIGSALSLLPIAIAGLGLLALLAWLSSRTTVYTITNRRVVMRIGVALTTTINIPFKVIGGAGLRTSARGNGDIPLALPDVDRIAYSALWPHARPWRLTKPEPMLRAIPDAIGVAAVLGSALTAAAANSEPSPRLVAVNRPSPQPSGRAPAVRAGRPIAGSLQASS